MDFVYMWWCLCSEAVLCFAPLRLTFLLCSLCCLHNNTAVSEKIILHALGSKGLCSNSPVSHLVWQNSVHSLQSKVCHQSQDGNPTRWEMLHALGSLPCFLLCSLNVILPCWMNSQVHILKDVPLITSLSFDVIQSSLKSVWGF